jgi:hypothetical protein
MWGEKRTKVKREREKKEKKMRGNEMCNHQAAILADGPCNCAV